MLTKTRKNLIAYKKACKEKDDKKIHKITNTKTETFRKKTRLCRSRCYIFNAGKQIKSKGCIYG